MTIITVGFLYLGFGGSGIMTVLLQVVVKYNIERHNDRLGLKQSTQTSHQDRFGLNDVLKKRQDLFSDLLSVHDIYAFLWLILELHSVDGIFLSALLRFVL